MKNIFQHGATLWDFCVISMRNDGICPLAELADFRRKKHMRIRAIREDTFSGSQNNSPFQSIRKKSRT